tara:strand:- start:1060 stop:1524 length:465 start_codon:yes stop_codon:yes gene_type:complete
VRIPLTLFLILIWTFLILAPLNTFAEEVDYPYADFQLQDIYQIDDGKTVYIEQTPVGHTIWVKDKSSKELNKISNVWFFYGIAKQCDVYGKILKNVLFASQKEYYMWGGIDEKFTIRMYNLYEPHPHFTYHTDIGMVPDMKEAKAWCTFYKPIY